MADAERLQTALREVYDPEIPINVYDLGLIYKLEESAPGQVRVDFTLTNPACPVGDILQEQIREALAKLDGVQQVEIRLVWEPPWSKERMTFEGQLQASMLGLG